MAGTSDRLTLTREISRSQIATVWEGFDTGLDRKVLVKAIHPQYAQQSDLRPRFENEARAIARISHPNVVQIYDLQERDGTLWLILEYVEGMSLGKVLAEKQRLPAGIAITILCSILEGLKQAHAKDIVHRDLKPDNVLISNGGEVKITDFGLARLKDLPTVTMEGQVVGTPAYMAPEQALGTMVSARTDLFACGLILFEMLTGKRVNTGTSHLEAYNFVMRYKPPDLGEYADCIPDAIRPVLEQLVEREPERRFEDVDEVRDTLIETAGGELLPTTLIGDFLSGKPVEESTLKPSVRGRSRRRGRLWWIPAAMLVVLLAILFADRWPSLLETPTTPADTSAVSAVPDEDTLAAPGDTSARPDPSGEPGTAIAEPDEGTTTGSEQPTATEPDQTPVVDRPTDTLVVEPGAVGRLQIQCRPWARIYIGDSLRATTPLAEPLTLAAGSHNIMLMNDEIGHPISRLVTIYPDSTELLEIDLYDYVARIRAASVRPWADVYVDGTLEFRTPSSKTIFKPLGNHVITLRNPAFPDYVAEVHFEQGDPVHEIRVDLAEL